MKLNTCIKIKNFHDWMDVPIFRIESWISNSSPIRINSVYQQKQQFCREAQLQSLKKRPTCIGKLNLQESRSSIKPMDPTPREMSDSNQSVFLKYFFYHQTHQFLADDPEWELREDTKISVQSRCLTNLSTYSCRSCSP